MSLRSNIRSIILGGFLGEIFGGIAGGIVGFIVGGFFPLPRARVHSTTVTPAPTPTLVSPETVITFPDKNLELSIRSASVGGRAG